MKANNQKTCMRFINTIKNEQLIMLIIKTNKLLDKQKASVQHQKNARDSDGIEHLKDFEAYSFELDVSRSENPLDSHSSKNKIRYKKIYSNCYSDKKTLLHPQLIH